MTRQRYVPEDNAWLAYGEADWDAFFDAVWGQVGAVFPMQRDGNRIMFDPDDLPAGVSQNDVEQAVRDNHPHR